MIRWFFLILSVWSSPTPGAHVIHGDHLDGLTRLGTSAGELVDSVDRWYFYRGYVVGATNKASRYFVFNERSAEVTRFPTRASWRAYLQQHSLVPAIYTRWYSDDWDFNMRDLGAYLVVEVFFSFVLAILVLLFASFYKTRQGNGNFPLGRFYLIMGLCLTGVFWVFTFADVLLSKFPGSF